MSRRDFCGYACIGAAVVAGCTTGGTGSIETGGTGGGGGGGGGGETPDARGSGSDVAPIDAGTGSGSGSGSGSGTVGTCGTATPTDVGAPSTFVTGTAVYFSAIKMFVVRDANGLYAVTARCTHEGATNEVQSGEFYCPRHGAEFDFDGNVLKGPASKTLGHYSLCLMANGHVGVIATQTVSQATRLDA